MAMVVPMIGNSACGLTVTPRSEAVDMSTLLPPWVLDPMCSRPSAISLASIDF
jgi:hypothetical protein